MSETLLPSQIAHFRIDSEIGVGGMGHVYKAFDSKLRRSVAIKTVRADLNGPEPFERLYREAQACARLQHPNIVTVHEVGEFNGTVYIAMEYLKGESLAAALRRNALTFEDKMRTLIQILEALNHAHSEHIIHRDIKPSNVHRHPDGSIKLIDFGLARFAQETRTTLTVSGEILGTLHYASPEQLKGERVDTRTDVYSTGVVAYEMISGRRPFEGEGNSASAVLMRALSEEPAPMNTLWTERFPVVQQIVSRAMAKAAHERFQSVVEMQDALKAFLASSGDAIAETQRECERTAQTPTLVVPSTGVPAPPSVQSAVGPTVVTPYVQPDAGNMPVATNATPSPSLSEAPTVGPPVPDVGADLPPSRKASADRRSLGGGGQVGPARRSMLRALWWGAVGVAMLVLAIAAVPVFRSATEPPAQAVPEEARPAVPVDTSPKPSTNGAPSVTPVANDAGSSAVAVPDARPPAAAPPAASSTGRDAVVPKPVQPAPSRPQAVPVEIPTRPVPNLSAKQMYAASPGVANGNPGLKYRVIEKLPTGEEIDADPSKTFHSGDRVRFAFESNIDGYLYVAQSGSSGRWTILFPNPEANSGKNSIRRSEQYFVPNNGWFAFDETPGTEEVFVILSREPLEALPGFNRPVVRLESVEASVVNNLRQGILSRDLVFAKDPPTSVGGRASQASYVVSRDELAKGVAAFVALKHAK